ncbi:MAG: hypothetical protein WA961_16820 [Rhodanobacter sp.]
MNIGTSGEWKARTPTARNFPDRAQPLFQQTKSIAHRVRCYKDAVTGGSCGHRRQMGDTDAIHRRHADTLRQLGVDG